MTLPRVGDLGDSVITHLAASDGDGRMSGSRVFDVGDRAYIGRVIEIPPHFGRDQLHAMTLPIDASLVRAALLRGRASQEASIR